MTPEQLANIQARADAATEGPWEVDRNYPFTSDLVGIWAPDSKQYIVQVENQDDVDDPTTREDANFIAAARTDVPALLALVREQQARIERARELHTFAHTDVEPWATSYRYSGDHCGFDGEHWPCATIAALTATEGAA